MKQNKRITAWDIRDMLWAKWELMLQEGSEKYASWSWKELVNYVSPTSVEEWVKVMALEKFLFELKYVSFKPSTDSMRHLWGCHVELYDVYGCDKHRFVVVTHDDCDRYIEGQTVFCPYCNEDKFVSRKMEEYISSVCGRVETPEMYALTLKRAKTHRKWQRKMNREYWIKKLFEKGYLQYRITRWFKSLFAQA